MNKEKIRELLKTVGPILGRGVIEVAVERMNQKNKGYDISHDKQHKSGELVAAAVAYALKSIETKEDRKLHKDEINMDEPVEPTAEDYYPWEELTKLNKLEDKPIELLKKAGALIAAEIDRRTAQEYTDEDRDLEDGGPPETQI